VIRVCSYCRLHFGEKEPLTDKSHTHGICEACKEALVTALKERNPALMGAIHEALRRLNDQPCRICSFADRTERAFIAQTHYMEFPKPGTPESEKIIVCEKCYRIVKIWMLISLNWEAEKEVIHGLSNKPLDHQIHPKAKWPTVRVQVPRRST